MSRDADGGGTANKGEEGLEIRAKVYPRMRRYIVQKRKGKRKRGEKKEQGSPFT